MIPSRFGSRHLRARTLLVSLGIAATPLVFAWWVDLRGSWEDLSTSPKSLTALTALVLALAVGLGAWLGRTWVAPIARLRDESRARVERPLTAPPLPEATTDEFGDLARAFNHLLAAVQTGAREKEAFVADLAHEMKNPIAAVRAAAESLATCDGLDAARAHRLARNLDASGRSLDALVTGLLELARAEAGLSADAREDVDLKALVVGLVATMQDGGQFPTVAFNVEGDVARVVGSAVAIERALGNLVLNAAQHAAARVDVRVGQDGDVGWVEVSDDGPGVPPAAIDRVFDRFYTSRGGGTGLGLALVKAVAEAHGGRATARSAPGAGATFRIELAVHAGSTPDPHTFH